MTQTTPPLIDSRPNSPRRANGLGITSLILGVLALVGAFIPFLNFGTGFLAFLGLVFGVIGLFLRERAKGMAIAGTILNAIALILSVVMAMTYTAAFAGAVSDSIASSDAKAAQEVTVVYEVTGSAKDASISYWMNDGGSEEANDVKLPWKKTFTAKVGGDFDYKFYDLTASNGFDDKGKISCSITIDDERVQKKTSSGSYASANCDASGWGPND